VETVTRDQVADLMDAEDATLVEVLPRGEYDWAHLPGAIHLSYAGWDLERVTARLDRDEPIVLYCNDFT
jgi:rhodanese-related sulfurtransferase